MEGEEDDGEYDEFNPYLFMKQLPPYNEVCMGGCLAGWGLSGRLSFFLILFFFLFFFFY